MDVSDAKREHVKDPSTFYLASAGVTGIQIHFCQVCLPGPSYSFVCGSIQGVCVCKQHGYVSVANKLAQYSGKDFEFVVLTVRLQNIMAHGPVD